MKDQHSRINSSQKTLRFMCYNLNKRIIVAATTKKQYFDSDHILRICYIVCTIITAIGILCGNLPLGLLLLILIKDPIWRETKKVIKKYEPFLDIDCQRYKKVILETIKEKL